MLLTRHAARTAAVKYIVLNKKRLKLTVWDTGARRALRRMHPSALTTRAARGRRCTEPAGQERFRTLTSSYYRGAQGIIFGAQPASLSDVGACR